MGQEGVQKPGWMVEGRERGAVEGVECWERGLWRTVWSLRARWMGEGGSIWECAPFFCFTSMAPCSCFADIFGGSIPLYGNAFVCG